MFLSMCMSVCVNAVDDLVCRKNVSEATFIFIYIKITPFLLGFELLGNYGNAHFHFVRKFNFFKRHLNLLSWISKVLK